MKFTHRYDLSIVKKETTAADSAVACIGVPMPMRYTGFYMGNI